MSSPTALYDRSGYYSPSHTVEYRGFGIVRKMDFGNQPHLIDGHMVKEGYLAIENGCNALPGATWGQTVQSVKNMIDDLITAREDAATKDIPVATAFWARVRLRRAAQKIALKMAAMLAGYAETDPTRNPELDAVMQILEDAIDTRSTTLHVDGKITRIGPKVTNVADYL